MTAANGACLLSLQWQAAWGKVAGACCAAALMEQHMASRCGGLQESGLQETDLQESSLAASSLRESASQQSSLQEYL
jgi:hypothetical protein